MANDEQLSVLKQGVEPWNSWRKRNPRARIDLSGVHLPGIKLTSTTVVLDESGVGSGLGFSGPRLDLSDADLRGAYIFSADLDDADFTRANLESGNFDGTDLSGAIFDRANLTNIRMHRAILSNASFICANMNKADLVGANLSNSNLAGANLRGARLIQATLTNAKLVGADLQGADLTQALLVNTDFAGAKLTNVKAYGISTWDVQLSGAEQSSIVITKKDHPTITVDNLEVAQFIYLLLHNEKIRKVIDTMTSKVVLILGRFTPERKFILDTIREEIRHKNYLPVVFDFDIPSSRDTHETITTLARLSRFVIADITEPKSIPQELVSIVEQLPSLPVQPILKHGTEPWGMYDHIKRYPWVLGLYRYHDAGDLSSKLLHEFVIKPVEKILETRG